MENPYKSNDIVLTKIKSEATQVTVNQTYNNEVQVKTLDGKLLWRTMYTVWRVGETPIAKPPVLKQLSAEDYPAAAHVAELVTPTVPMKTPAISPASTTLRPDVKQQVAPTESSDNKSRKTRNPKLFSPKRTLKPIRKRKAKR